MWHRSPYSQPPLASKLLARQYSAPIWTGNISQTKHTQWVPTLLAETSSCEAPGNWSHLWKPRRDKREMPVYKTNAPEVPSERKQPYRTGFETLKNKCTFSFPQSVRLIAPSSSVMDRVHCWVCVPSSSTILDDSSNSSCHNFLIGYMDGYGYFVINKKIEYDKACKIFYKLLKFCPCIRNPALTQSAAAE